MAICWSWFIDNEGVTPMGANSREDGVDWSQFGLPLAFIIGLIGCYIIVLKTRECHFLLCLYFY